MRTLTINVVHPDDVVDDIIRDAERATTGINTGAILTFPNASALARTVLAANRLEIINAMTGAGAMSIRELSRRVERDFKAVHTDVQALLNSGVIDQEGTKIVFPYDAIHFDFILGKAAA